MTTAYSHRCRPSAAPTHPLWTLTKHGQTAEARTRMTPLGPALLLSIGGRVLWSQILADGRDVGILAERARADFLARGWIHG